MDVNVDVDVDVGRGTWREGERENNEGFAIFGQSLCSTWCLLLLADDKGSNAREKAKSSGTYHCGGLRLYLLAV